jgi:hypothetical protein
VSSLAFLFTLAIKAGQAATKTKNIHKWKSIQGQKNQGLGLLQHRKIIAQLLKCPKNINIVDDVKNFIELRKYS